MAETEQCETEAQIQEKTISSQTEELKKISEDADGNDVEMPLKNGVNNHVEAEENIVEASDSVVVEEKPISESNEADCGIADELPSNEADSGIVEEKREEKHTECKEADSAIEEEKPRSEGIVEADSVTMAETSICESKEADSGTAKETNIETTESQADKSPKAESVSSTAAVTSENGSKEDSKANGLEEKKEDDAEKKDSLGSTVAKHYNEISPGTKELRKDSRIFHLRNFNNWIKSVIISEYLEKIKRRKRISDDINVLDLACGKGGDLLKWQKGKIDHIIMADIASLSIDQCKERYAKLQKEQRSNRYYRERLFTAEFFAADCTKEKLNALYRRKDIKLDLSSCQFAFHYSFESYEQADMMLKNLCENLRVGGYFIGTTPDAQKLVKHIKACKADSFGNSVFNIKPEDKDTFPLFGSKYMFYLEGVVDCPEFIVYLPLLEKMAAKYNMKLVWKKNFHDIFKEYEREHASLLVKMSALEQYPAATGQLAGGSESQYKSAKDYVDKKGNKRVGTLSADEWEVAGLYIAFAFEKMEPPRETKPKEREERETKPKERDERKRPRDDRGSRSEERHHEKRKADSSAPKRSKKDVDTDEVYEIKDEVYEDDTEKSEEKSKSEKSSKSKSKERSSSRRKSDETTKEKSAEIPTDTSPEVIVDEAESKKEEIKDCEEDKEVKSESVPEESIEMPEAKIEETPATILETKDSTEDKASEEETKSPEPSTATTEDVVSTPDVETTPDVVTTPDVEDSKQPETLPEITVEEEISESSTATTPETEDVTNAVEVAEPAVPAEQAEPAEPAEQAAPEEPEEPMEE